MALGLWQGLALRALSRVLAEEPLLAWCGGFNVVGTVSLSHRRWLLAYG